MLPCYQRERRHGGKTKVVKKRRSTSQGGHQNTECGFSIQEAITTDLITLRGIFRKELFKHTKQNAVSSNHCEAGTVFSIFKESFRSSKIGMLHLLAPARCDREAYSQLIYAACLALFKESFEKIARKGAFDVHDDDDDDDGNNNDDINHYDDAVFSIFSLFVLFETHPLPRRVTSNDNPLELLSISLRSSEDARASYRRCFSKSIRVDRKHLFFLLRMKELSLAKKGGCESSFYELQRIHLEDFKSGKRQINSKFETEQESSCDCCCGMSTDVLEILNRLFSRIELCEYTGPVGAEAFAGHPEYPHHRSINSEKNENKNILVAHQHLHSRQSERNQDYYLESSYECPNEIESSARKYKNSVTAIRIPPSNSNADQRLQKALKPLFLLNNGNWLNNSENKRVHQATRTFDSCFETKRDANNLYVEKGYGRSTLFHFDENQGVGTQKNSKASRKHKIVFHDEIGEKLKKKIRASMLILLAREEHILPLADVSNDFSKFSDTDDVSSIGDGGISIRTRQGEAAIHEYCHVMNKTTLSKNLGKSEKKIAKQSLANAFLTSKLVIDPVASSDEGSVNSEITMLSVSDSDDVNDDTISVATSGFGKRALEDLLQSVAKEETTFYGNERNDNNN